MIVYICLGAILCLMAAHIIFIIYKPKKSLKDKHVVITGGSSGIGKQVALECIKRGAHVSILARNHINLASTVNELRTFCDACQEVRNYSVDVGRDVELKCILEKLDKCRPIYMMVNCAGKAICEIVENTPTTVAKTLIDVNFLGSFYAARTVVPWMKIRNEGIIVFTSSQAGLLGIYGFSMYSATKYALRGLAEAIDMEVRPHNISVTVSLPPDTDTPGLEEENKQKLLETKLISDSGGLFQAEDVAKKLVDDALIGKFYSCIGLESFILTTLCCGMSPFVSVFELMYQVALMGFLRLISSFYILNFRRVVRNCKAKTN